MLLSKEHLEELSVGDVVKATPGIWPKLSEEAVHLRVKEKTAGQAVFVITYFGVTLGRTVARVAKGGVEWSSK